MGRDMQEVWMTR